MPGIAGIIGKANGNIFERNLSLMLKCMMHESFYRPYQYVNKHTGVYVGSVSLNGSFSDCMPVWNEKKDSCLFFSGEDFVDRDIKEELKFRGHEFDSSNASYIIHIYEEKGDCFIDNLNGTFCGVIIDNNKDKVILFNDRYGLQRIYFHENNDAFYFSSESKSLLKVIPELRHLDYRSLGEMISCGCVLENRTLFLKIDLLPGASKWTFRNGIVAKKEKYFNTADLENIHGLDIEAYYRKFRDTFARILPRYFDSQREIGISLTGGFDTRMILAFMEPKPGQYPCYTFGSMLRDSADVKTARQLTEYCHHPFQVIRVGHEFLSDFPALAEKTVFLTDGNLDVSGTPDLYANRFAREFAPIRMTGNYGSEVIRRNVAFKPNVIYKSLFNTDFYKHIQDAESTYAEIRKGHPLSFFINKQAPWHHYGRLALEQSQLTIRSPFLDNDLLFLLYQAPKEATTGTILLEHLIKDRNPRLFDVPTDRGIGGNTNIAFSTIAQTLQYFTFKAEYAYDYGMPQWLAKIDHVFRRLHLENLFLGRHKFYHFRVWYRNELSGYVREILLDKRTMNRPYLNKDILEDMVSGHLKGNYNNTIEIHQTLTAELIQRLFVD